MSKLPILRLKNKEGRRVRAGAPWAFSNEITLDPAAKALAAGALVRLAGADGTLIGTGYFNPQSLIAVRLLGAADATIDASFLAARLRRALSLREQLFAAPYYRLVHAEGDGLPGLVIDRFAGTLVVQVTTAGMERLTPDILAALEQVLAP